MSRSGWVRGRQAAIAAVVPALILSLLPQTAFAGETADGADGIGDPYFPLYGNGGYDVSHYDIDIAVDGTAPTGTLAGTTTIKAKALQKLDAFNLDFVLDVSNIKVNGENADYSLKQSRELVVEPASPIANGSTFTVEVTYDDVPDSKFLDGFNPVYAGSGGLLILGEPMAAPWWFPSNDHPRDKATYDIHVSVPNGEEAMSVGELVSSEVGLQRDTWNYKVAKPMATYLAFLGTGQYDVIEDEIHGLPVLTGIGEGSGAAGEAAAADFARLDEVIEFLESQFGPYRFKAFGNVVVQTSLGFALETQTRPTFSPQFWGGGSSNISVVVHEQAHQWWGDNVSVHNWRDVWLNEGFATFAQWRWEEATGGQSAQEILADEYNGRSESDPFWDLRIGDPGPGSLFAGAVYDRGAMTIQALRNRIGDADLHTVFMKWHKKHKYDDASIKKFMKLSEKVSGENLQGFFDHWLYTGEKPAPTAENGLEDVVGAPMTDLAAWQRLSAKIAQIAAAESSLG